MVSLTAAAGTRIKFMSDENEQSSPGIRLSVVGGGCSGLSYDIDFESEELEGDSVITSEGVALYIDPMSLQYLEGTSIDYTEGFAYSGFNFENPKAKKSCGCGSSFTV